MTKYRFKKTNRVNGFDKVDRDNARQNNYAWSMEEFNGYIYVGTGRNIPYSTIVGLGITPPTELTPENPSNAGEIWRYPVSCQNGMWERVYQATKESEIMGFRYMIVYTNDSGDTALYCASFGVNTTSNLLTTTNGIDFYEVSSGLPVGFTTRSMTIFNNKLYSGATNALDFSSSSYLYVTENPENGWKKVEFKGDVFPTGEVVSMISFNGYLYIGTSPTGGFEIWKSADPESGEWQLVVDKGAGDALNEVPMSMEVFKNHLYVGTGIWIGFQSVDPDKTIVPPKGFDVIQICKDDTWEVIVGSTPISPTRLTTGDRNSGRYPSGFGSIFNSYCWNICAYEDTLIIGSWDSAVLWDSVLKSLVNIDQADIAFGDLLSDDEFSLSNILAMLSELEIEIKPEYDWISWLLALVKSIPKYPEEFGFDLWVSNDGMCFCSISKDGFENSYNYGLRTMLVSHDGCKLFIGTANPFQGCEVWKVER